ncbi:MAG: hypothetical protein JSS10_00280 [Verrucomicrobia bacterium]|nr:hypothetical protein [Verrucomicrobiota bacterium]
MELNFTHGALMGAAAGAVVGHICWQRPWFGATGGVIHATAAVAVNTLFGRKVFYAYVVVQGLVGLGKLGKYVERLQLRENIERFLRMHPPKA